MGSEAAALLGRLRSPRQEVREEAGQPCHPDHPDAYKGRHGWLVTRTQGLRSNITGTWMP